MTKQLVFAGVTAALAITYIVIGEDEEVQTTASSSNEIKKNIETSEKPIVKKNIEILYLDGEEPESSKEEEKVNSQESYSSKNTTNTNTEYLYGEKAQEYIEKKGYVKISPDQNRRGEIPRYSVYSDISVDDAKAQRNKMLPPSAPVSISGTLDSGQVYTTFVDADVFRASKKIAITSNSPTGEIEELKELAPQELPNNTDNTQNDTYEEDIVKENNDIDFKLVAPPSIGQ